MAEISTAHAELGAFMRRYTPFSASELKEVLSHWQPLSASVGQQLLCVGEVCRHVYFLHEGLMRYYYRNGDGDGEEVTKFFTEPPYVFAAQRSLNAAAPSVEGITAVTPSQLLVIELAEVERLYGIPAWGTFVRKLVAEVQYFTEEILLEAQSHTAEERYHKLLIERPGLLLQLSQKHVASYLGIAPQSLSRIRARVAAEGLGGMGNVT